ncbi:MAG: hypothetical protein ABWZ76_13815 [Acidimicrobiales bacterium]
MTLMRLRQSPIRALDEDWVQPRRSGRWTTIGNLDSANRAAVDPAGLVTVDGAPWSLDWWIGAEDRWHLPCREVAVRQSLVGGSPVIETRLRVPSGDAVHRSYAARNLEGDEAVVVEIENQSTVPFAVALAMRPHDQSAVGRIDELALDGSTVRVDGRLALLLPRSPGRIALSTAEGGDSAAIVLTGGAEPVRPGAVHCGAGLAQAALLFPLAHTATLRVVVPLGDDGEAPAAGPQAYPSAQEVASGWSLQAGRGARLEVPDRRLRDAVAASVRHLLLGQGALDETVALDLAGFPAEAARSLINGRVDLARSDRPGAALATVVRHWELTRDTEFARGMVDLVAALLARLGRVRDGDDRGAGNRALPGAAAMLEAAGEARAAADVLVVARRAPAAPAPGGPGLRDLLGAANGTWSWPGPRTGHDPVANAALVRLVRDQLVADGDDGLVLSPGVPESWLGQGWELHDAPTRHGRLSYAVRWHGDRPALLWHVDPHDADAAVRLTVPTLDPAWSSTACKGDALLGPVALPVKAPRRGLSTPVTVEPMPGRGRD